jgi:hypothetical protein
MFYRVKQEYEVLINQIKNNSWVPPKDAPGSIWIKKEVIPGYFSKSDQTIKEEAFHLIVREEL